MFAFTLALTLLPTADPKLNPRQVAEGYITAALTGNPDDAVKFAEEGKSPSKSESVKKFKELIGAETLALPTVLFSDNNGYALAVSDAIKLRKPLPSGTDRGCLLFTLKKTNDGVWVIKDIDVRSADEAATRVKDAKKVHDDAKDIAPTKS